MSRVDKIATIQSDLQAFSTHVYLFQQQVAEKMRMHPTDFHSIHLLDRHGEMTAGKLAAHLGLTSGATTTAIDRLVKLGYVKRMVSDTDRRSIVVRLQPDVVQKMRREYLSIDEQLQDRLGRFSDAELGTIERFMQSLTGL